MIIFQIDNYEPSHSLEEKIWKVPNRFWLLVQKCETESFSLLKELTYFSWGDTLVTEVW